MLKRYGVVTGESSEPALRCISAAIPLHRYISPRSTALAVLMECGRQLIFSDVEAQMSKGCQR